MSLSKQGFVSLHVLRPSIISSLMSPLFSSLAASVDNFSVFFWLKRQLPQAPFSTLRLLLPQPKTCRSLGPPILICFFRQQQRREAALLPCLTFIFSFSVPACTPSTSLSLPQPVPSQTERVSRGLERNHLCAPPPLTPFLSLSISLSPSSSSLTALHLTSLSLLSSPLLSRSSVSFAPIEVSQQLPSLHADTYNNKEVFSVCTHTQIQNDVYT